MSEQLAFDALVDEFYQVWFRYHPDVALSLGICGVDIDLPAVQDDDVSALGSWLENLIVALGELNASALEAGAGLDYRLLLEAAQLEYEELLTRDWRHLDPPRFLPIQEIFLLTLHPPENLSNTLRRLLEGVPAYLRHARSRLCELPSLISPEMAEVAIEDARTGIQYLRALAESAWLKHHCRTCADLDAAFDTAIGAIDGYAAMLGKELVPAAAGALGCGEAYFQRLLRHRHFITLPIEGLRAYLEAMYRDGMRRLERQARTLGIDASPGAAFAYLAQRPDYLDEERLQVYRDESNRLHDYLRNREIVTVPECGFRIVERPVCPRPGRCDSGYMPHENGCGGVFFVSGRVVGNRGEGETRAMIRSHCLSQGWAGAHLLAFGNAGRLPRARSLPRRTASTGGFAIAWDLYIRDYLAGTDFFEPDDKLRHVLYRMRAVRLALLDLDLNLHRTDASDALELLMEWEPDRSEAMHRILELARRPADQFAGVVGWMMLHQAREAGQARDSWLIGEFHDALLSEGMVPPALLLPHLFGDELWLQVSDELTI